VKTSDLPILTYVLYSLPYTLPSSVFRNPFVCRLSKHLGVSGYSSVSGVRTRKRFDAHLYAQTAIFWELRSVPVVWRGGNAHAAKFILVILFVEDVPLLAAFKDFFFLRGDALADF
jgi:hypothetical protein